MRNIFRQTNDPEVEAGLQETRPFFWFLILVLVLLYVGSIYASPELRQPALFLPYTTLFFIHIALHWYMPYLVAQKRKLAAYLAVQILLVNLLVLISREPGLVIGLYTTLAGETIGILEDWRRSLVAIVGYLALMGALAGGGVGIDVVQDEHRSVFRLALNVRGHFVGGIFSDIPFGIHSWMGPTAGAVALVILWIGDQVFFHRPCQLIRCLTAAETNSLTRTMPNTASSIRETSCHRN